MRGITGTQNISKHKEGFQVEKIIDGHKKYFGFGRTLIEALMITDIVSENNWTTSISKLNPHRYIHKSKNGSYMITRKIKGKTRYYGHFLQLEEAIEFRDFLESKGWSTNYRFCRNPDAGIYLNNCGSYEVFHYHNGKNEYYGSYHSFEEAKRVKELCKKFNGNWDLICECEEFETDEWLTGINLKPTFEKKKERNDYFIVKNGGI